MAISIFIAFTLLVCARASIDSIIEEVEIEYDKLVEEEGSGKAARPAWDEYVVTNRTEEYVKYQLDMIISKHKFEQLMAVDELGRKKRNAVRFESQLWPRTIPYEIDDKFEIKWQYQILLAIQHVMQHTCVVFKPRDQETNYIKFIRTLSGCNSHVGMMLDEHPINLAVPSCMSKETIAHEIAHALGLYHEHMRNDRDQHVIVFEDSIETGKSNQFRRMEVSEYDDYSKPYDYRSLMHYGKNYFGKRHNATFRHVTMEPLQFEFLDVIGEAPGLSYYDIEILNSMYKCAASCKPRLCHPGEFLGKNCECFCRSGSPDYSAVPCEQQASCLPPDDLDPNTHYAFDLTTEMEMELTQTTALPSGRSVEIGLLDPGICGRQMTVIKCQNGVWDSGVNLPCVKVRCKFNPNWSTEYQMFPSYFEMTKAVQDDLPHGEYIDLICLKNNQTITTLDCVNGNWEGQSIPCSGENCTVKYPVGTHHIYTIEGKNLKAGQVEAVCRAGAKDNDVTNVTCIDGHWRGDPPSDCPQADPQCPVIAEATVTSHSTDAHRFSIKCLRGYDMLGATNRARLQTSSFTCERQGAWSPNTPVCSPATCSVPAVTNGVVKSHQNKFLPSGSFVNSGNDVTLLCEHGHYPDKHKVSCRLGEWNTGRFPVCTKVVCPKPPVTGTQFKPKKTEYLYSDKVNVGSCPKSKELVGDRVLTCRSDSTWSGQAKCQNYCADGNKTWVEISGQRVDKDGLKLRRTVSFEACKQRCEKHRRFLCLSVSYGFSRNSYKPSCELHRIDLNAKPDMLKEGLKWAAAKRVCM